MFDYSPFLGSDLARGLSRIAVSKARYALTDFGIEVAAEDIASELYMEILSRPELKTWTLSKALGVLRAEANIYICKIRDQRGGFFTSPDLLVRELKAWHTEGLSHTVEWCLYDPESVFADAGIPPGSYRQVIQDAYWDGIFPAPGRPAGKRLNRAVARLSEVLSGVLVGPVKALDVEAHDLEDDPYLELEFDADAAGVFDGLYSCTAGHTSKFSLAVEPPKTIGSPRGVYGLRFCACGKDMKRF